ncbi:MAG: DUF4202 domain-containing protein [Proteobacteria bacterium]|nr:DUF4202 domain-containing protein [Pseudomonadota bacterium]
MQNALTLIDTANAEDPRDEEGQPKELLYGRRMGEMLSRYLPDASEVVRLAVRAQHLRRWRIPRTDYPADRDGYYHWRNALYRFHAEQAGCLLAEAGYDAERIARVEAAVGKRQLPFNPDAQDVEDVAALVFLEHYLAGFVAQKMDYSEDKLRNIIIRTWRKMSPAARQFVLDDGVSLPVHLVPLIRSVVAK